MGHDMKKAGNYLFSVAMLDDEGKMSGSIMVMDFKSKKELDDWMKIEPYITNKVWETIEVIPCQVGPSFAK